jgi:predicted patatin/cPLA2 family phospholipase
LIPVRCSSNLPWFFSDFNFNGNSYTDGGLTDNFPIHLADKTGHNVLGFVTEGGCDLVTHPTLNKIFKRMNAPVANIVRVRIENMTPRCRIVRFPITNDGVLNLSITNTQILDLVTEGKALIDVTLQRWEDEHQKKD